MTDRALHSLEAVADRQADEARAKALSSEVLRLVIRAARAGEPWAEEVVRCANEAIERGGGGLSSRESDDPRSLLSSVDGKLLASVRAKRRQSAKSASGKRSSRPASSKARAGGRKR